VAARFNGRYGPTFTVPDAEHPTVAARIMDLADPSTKMGKTNASGAGVLFLLDPPDVLRRKIMRAVTDAGVEVRYAPAEQPGVSNLLEIMAACVPDEPAVVAGLFDTYGQLKSAVADTVVSTLRPIQARYQDLARDPGYVQAVLAEGAQRARERTAGTVRRARQALGLLTPRVDEHVGARAYTPLGATAEG